MRGPDWSGEAVATITASVVGPHARDFMANLLGMDAVIAAYARSLPHVSHVFHQRSTIRRGDAS